MRRPPDQDDEDDGRSPIALAMEWSSRLTGISMELVLPTLGGLWLDRRLGTLPLFLVVGGAIGFTIATLSLLRLTQTTKKGR